MFARNKFTLGIGVALLVIGVTLIVACSAERPTATTTSATTTPVIIAHSAEQPTTPASASSVSRVADRTAASTVKATGNLLSENQVTLSFQIGGRVKEVFVKEGDKVKAGMVLASLDTGTLETQVVQAQALFNAAMATFDKVRAGPTPDEVAIARSNLERAKAGVDQAQAAYDRIGGATAPFIAMMPQSLALQQATQTYQAAIAQYNLAVNHPTAQELATAAAQVAQAQLALDQAKQTLINAKLIAPSEGTVVAFTAKVGESATTGVPMATVADLSKMQVLVNVDENTLASVKVGQSVKLSLDVLNGQMLTGRVRKIGLLGTSTTNIVSVPVTIDIDPTDAPIYPGLSATIEFQAK
ncbi:MAG: efflux RND transporter periplasmic adaptor subunit [Chloroflexi bacterium]|nr:efflux RND transporter periplasmic adaptor subunit [Chloroflexota bacterium]